MISLVATPRIKVCQNGSRLQVLMVVAQKKALTKPATLYLSASLAIGAITESGTSGSVLRMREPSLLRTWRSSKSQVMLSLSS